MMGSDDEIRGLIYSLRENEISLEEFEQRFVETTWDNRGALAGHVDHALAERSLMTTDELLGELLRAAATLEVRDVPAKVLPSTSAGSTLVQKMRVGGNATIMDRIQFAGT